MVDPVPQTSATPQDFVRQTQHRAVNQMAPTTDQSTQPIENYQPPQTQPVVTPPQTAPTQPTTNQPPQPAQPPNPGQESALFPGVSKPIPEEVVVEWTAPSRPFKPRKRQYFTTVILMALLISLILFFANQFLPILVVLAVAFLSYVLAVVPPGMVKHSLTTYGIRIEDQLYYWEELGRFWLTTKYGQNVLHIEVARFPWRLTLLLGDIPADQMKLVLAEVLINQKPPLTPIEKAAEWLQEKIPLDGE